MREWREAFDRDELVIQYSGGVWHAAQPRPAENTASPRAAMIRPAGWDCAAAAASR